jgi:hypothetical protein
MKGPRVRRTSTSNEELLVQSLLDVRGVNEAFACARGNSKRGAD